MRPLPPVYPASWVAKAILQNILDPKREQPVGTAAYVMLASENYAPSLTEKWMSVFTRRNHFKDQPEGARHGDIFDSVSRVHTISGGWKNPLLIDKKWAVLATVCVAGGFLAGRAAVRRFT